MRVYINNRNYLTWPRRMTEILLGQGHEVIIFDNASTYPPLLEWYDTECPCQQYRCNQNLASRAIWNSGVLQGYDKPYVVTDPDLDISRIPRNWPDKLMEGCERYGVHKCGFSLEEQGVPTANPAWLEDKFCDHPDGLPYIWGKKLAGGFLDYPTDTTFALYLPQHPESVENTRVVVGGIRTDRPYTAIHLPWHITLEEEEGKLSIPMDDEMYFYFTHANEESLTGKRLAPMLQEYARRKLQQ